MSFWMRVRDVASKKKTTIICGLTSLVCMFAIRWIWNRQNSRKEKTLFDVLNGTVKSKKELNASIFKVNKTEKAMSQPSIPRPTCPDTPRFDFNHPSQAAKGLRYMELHGYVVAANVLSIEEIEKAKDLFWGWVKGLLKRYPDRFTATEKDNWVKPNAVETWDHRNWPADTDTGIIFGRGIGQSAFLWFVRSRPLVKKVFSHIWGTSDLLTSFDGCGVFRPWRFKPEWKTKGGWYHVDQNAKMKIGKHCVQGLVSLYDGGADTGGLTVIDGSHKQFRQVRERIKSNPSGDFVMMPKTEPLLQTPGRLIKCKAGDLLLWDSRTIHCNSPGDYAQKEEEKDRIQEVCIEKNARAGKCEQHEQNITENSWDLIRLVAYICMTPRSKAKPSVLENRKSAPHDLLTTNHWPHEFHPDKGAPPLVIPNTPYLQSDLI